jgi:hypothetical protein
MIIGFFVDLVKSQLKFRSNYVKQVKSAMESKGPKADGPNVAPGTSKEEFESRGVNLCISFYLFIIISMYLMSMLLDPRGLIETLFLLSALAFSLSLVTSYSYIGWKFRSVLEKWHSNGDCDVCLSFSFKDFMNHLSVKPMDFFLLPPKKH